MGWIRKQTKQTRVVPHVCPLPPKSDGEDGDLWGCDSCGQVWELKWPDDMTVPHWAEVGWFKQWRYQEHYACGCAVGSKPCLPGSAPVTHGTRLPTLSEVANDTSSKE